MFPAVFHGVSSGTERDVDTFCAFSLLLLRLFMELIFLEVMFSNTVEKFILSTNIKIMWSRKHLL